MDQCFRRADLWILPSINKNSNAARFTNTLRFAIRLPCTSQPSGEGGFADAVIVDERPILVKLRASLDMVFTSFLVSLCVYSTGVFNMKCSGILGTNFPDKDSLGELVVGCVGCAHGLPHLRGVMKSYHECEIGRLQLEDLNIVVGSREVEKLRSEPLRGSARSTQSRRGSKICRDSLSASMFFLLTG